MVVVAAIDRSRRAPEVIEEAEQLANAFGVPLHVVHVLSRSDFVELERSAYEETGKAADMEEIREAARSYAEDAASGVASSYEAVGLVGEVADRVIEYAKDRDARYIVVGPRKRSPTGKALFGSKAQSLILNSPIPIVTRSTDTE